MSYIYVFEIKMTGIFPKEYATNAKCGLSIEGEFKQFDLNKLNRYRKISVISPPGLGLFPC